MNTRKAFEKQIKDIYGICIVRWSNGMPYDRTGFGLKPLYELFLSGRQYEQDKTCLEFAKSIEEEKKKVSRYGRK